MNKRDRSPVILVVDDHEDNRELLETFLSRRGFKVLTACNGLEAIMAAARDRPDLIIMDLAMPVMDGFAAVRLMRELPKSLNVPVIACTGYGATHQPKAMQDGFNEFLTKPIDFDKLESAINRLLKLR